MTENHLTKLAIAIGISLATTTAIASPQQPMSSRSFAMGGTGVAVAHPASAGLSNPAMLAADQHNWSDDFGLILPSVNARFADEEETIDQIDDIQDTIDDFQELNRVSESDEARRIAGDLRRQLNEFDEDTVRVDAGLTIAAAIPTDEYSIGFFTTGNLRTTVRGELDDQDDAFLRELETADELTLATADLDRDLQSRGSILASAVIEVGVSLARSMELSDGNTLQIGFSPKYVQLRTFQYTERVSGFDDDDFDSSESETTKSGLNFDLGMAYTFGDDNEWTTGAVVKNVIPMDLESAASRPELGEKKRKLKLHPMVTAGIAHRGDFHVLTAELDLTEKEAFGYEDDTQWLALGAEFDVLRYAQLRAGVRQNLASNDDNEGIEEETQFTAGIGLSPFGARLDIGALFSDADLGAAIELGVAF
ncbi:conjugative transfer protein [Marinobacter lipolyticus SM19]|uniref:Conjugative transfer protein n=1 Tax=Marinobacter lipolyticus SM19 TaxID=1318628 RepID=R8B3F7_9GAMM|nr:conjugal transfer protein TraF [Marinobacter lipolyticus]EON93140.1 conjugative transfer protein [Marinobacter lipolyticus SM19]